jgi:hypothetical protein
LYKGKIDEGGYRVNMKNVKDEETRGETKRGGRGE